MTLAASRRAAFLERYGGRPFLVAVAALNAITGLAALAVLAPLSFGTDARAFRRGAEAIARGAFDTDFLYTPLAGLVARPLTWLSPDGAAVAMALVGLGVLIAGVWLETRGHAAIDRVLVFVAVVTFLPVINELLLGQVTLLFAAALLPVVRRPDGMRNGVALGIALALAPKPLLVPVLVWMLVRRPRALLGLLAASAVTAAVGLLLMGVDLHRLWLDTLGNAGSVLRNGNRSLWADSAGLMTVAAAVLVTAATAFAIWRDESAGFIAALFAGLLLAPYTLVYSASILLIAVVPSLRLSPVATRALALVGNPAMIAAFGAWCVAGLASVLAAARHRRTT